MVMLVRLQRVKKIYNQDLEIRDDFKLKVANSQALCI